MTAVHDNEAQQRYEVVTDEGTAFLDYRRGGGVIILVHTEVPEPLRGRGIGEQLARHALEAARSQGWRVSVRCPYVARFLEQHPEYADLARRSPSVEH